MIATYDNDNYSAPLNETYESEDETETDSTPNVTYIYICVYVIGFSINVYLSCRVLHQNYVTHRLNKFKPGNIYALDTFVGDAILFGLQMLSEGLSHTQCTSYCGHILQVLEFVIPIITLHSIVMYTFLAWERCVTKIKF
jgi:hypothetical protein